MTFFFLAKMLTRQAQEFQAFREKFPQAPGFPSLATNRDGFPEFRGSFFPLPA